MGAGDDTSATTDEAAGFPPLRSPLNADQLRLLHLVKEQIKANAASALTVHDLPKINILLLSHAHFDHFDMRTLHRFDRSP